MVLIKEKTCNARTPYNNVLSPIHKSITLSPVSISPAFPGLFLSLPEFLSLLASRIKVAAEILKKVMLKQKCEFEQKKGVKTEI